MVMKRTRTRKRTKRKNATKNAAKRKMAPPPLPTRRAAATRMKRKRTIRSKSVLKKWKARDTCCGLFLCTNFLIKVSPSAIISGVIPLKLRKHRFICLGYQKYAVNESKMQQPPDGTNFVL